MRKTKAAKQKGRVKKAAIAVVAAVLAAGFLIGTAGCGSKGDVSQAKKLMKQGDNYIAEFESLNGPGGQGGNGGQPPDQGAQGNQNNAQGDQNTRNGQGNNGGQPSEADMEERAKEMEENTDKMKGYLTKAESSYKEILSLSGASAYKEYANKMLELISAYEEQLTRMEEMAANMTGDGTRSGNPPDMSSGNPPDMSNGAPPSGSANGTIPEGMQNGDRNAAPGGNQEIQTLKEEAQKIKEENNL